MTQTQSKLIALSRWRSQWISPVGGGSLSPVVIGRLSSLYPVALWLWYLTYRVTIAPTEAPRKGNLYGPCVERLLFLPVSFHGGNLNPRTTPIVKGSWRMWYDLAACPGTRGGEFDELLASFPWKREEKEKMGVDARPSLVSFACKEENK